ncbi:MAG: hypothetical protein AAGD38_06370 [Acidobacteriota bacterium]
MRLLFPTPGWTPVEGDARRDLMEQVTPIDDTHELHDDSTVVKRTPLPFYDNVDLLAIYDETWTNEQLIVYYLTLEDQLFRLNGTSPPIHEVNAKAPIKLEESNALSYLKFFCFFVHGKEGAFYIFENLDDPFLTQDIIEDRKKIIQSLLQPATLIHITEDGRFFCTCLIWYADALFFSNMVIQPTGMIEMSDDEPMAADLPARIRVPLS